MQNNNLCPIIRLIVSRTFYVTSFVFLSVIISLIVIDEASAELITFDDYPEGTPITVQYQNLGVIISGEPQPPIIYNGHPMFGLEDPILGCSSSSSSIIVSFVDPADGSPVEATSVWFYGYYFFYWHSTPVTMTYYDIDGNIIGQESIALAGGQLPPFNFPPKLHKFVLAPGTYTYAWINNLNFQLLAKPPTLIDPGPSTEKYCESMAGKPINLTTGDVWISKTDYSVPGLAGGLSMSRTWNSLWNRSNPPFESGMFGRGWTSEFEERLQVFNSTYIIYWRGSGNIWVFEAPVGCSSCAYYLRSPANQQASLQYNNATNQYTVSFTNGTKKIFSNSGRLLSAIDRNGNQVTVSYDNFDRITRVSTSGGQWIAFTYSNSQNLAANAYDAVGTVATFSYVGSNLTRVAYPNGSQINYAYDTADNIISVTDNEGKVLETHTYDNYGRGLSSSRADSVDFISIEYPFSSSTILTDSKGNVTTYSYSRIKNNNYLTAVEGPGCNSCGGRNNLSFTLDGLGNRLSQTDANGNIISYTYDSAGNVLTKTNVAGTWTYTYNSFGEVLSARDPQGNITTYIYDTKGNLTSVTQPSPDGGATPGPKTQFFYDAKGQLTKVTDPLGNSTSITYSPTGLTSTIKNAQRKVTSFGYDGRGNPLSITDALGQTTSFIYDVMNRLTKINYPDNSTQQFTYDTRGRRISVTDANNLTTRYYYDDADRLTLVTDPASNQTAYFYDAESNLTSVVDSLNRATSFAYDNLGRRTRTIFPSELFEAYSYDNVGNLISKTDRNGQTIYYTYDQLNRLTQKSYESYSATYSYDSLNRLTQVSDPTGTYQLLYDNLGRLRRTITNYSFLSNKSFTLTYGYDAASNRILLTDPENGLTTYAYNTLNLITSLTDPKRNKFSWTYDAIGRPTNFSRPNAVATSYTYDSLSRLLSISHTKQRNILDGAKYTLDAAGTRKSRTLLPEGTATNYVYDNLDQLLDVVQNSSTTESYSYDEVGNRLSSNWLSPYIYNVSNELIWTPELAYTYDNNGNLLSESNSEGTITYLWTPENQLASITLPGSGGTVSFQYDPFGRRIYKSSPLDTTIFVYDGSNVIQEVSANGSVTARYAQSLGIDEPLSMQRGNTTSYYQADGLGSITSFTDSKGNLVSKYMYDSFGNLTVSTGAISNPFRFTGREFDSETGLYYYRARYYDPTIGRFISEDPIGFAGGDVNFYVYVGNNPVNFVDPLGLFSAGYKFGYKYPGHADFPGGDYFDYNLEDTDPATNPITGDPERHFRDLPVSERDVADAINSCDKNAFQRAMHRGQDYFSHYSKGYRWKPGSWNRGLGFGHMFPLIDPTAPDRDREAWNRAAKWSQDRLDEWNKKCGCKK